MKRQVTHTVELYLQPATHIRSYGDFPAAWMIKDSVWDEGSIEDAAEEHVIDHVMPNLPLP